MKNIFFILMIFISTVASAQQAFDIVTYTLPGGWKLAEQKENAVQFQKIEGKNWAQITIYKNTISKGTIEADFESEWNELAAAPFQIKEAPVKTSAEDITGGWKKISGSAKWIFNGSNVITTVTTYHRHGACVSIICNTTLQKFTDEYNQLLSTVQLQNENAENTPQQSTLSTTNKKNTVAVSNGYKFNTTTFDDGWVSTVREDWVDVSKGNIKVLIHFPKEGTVFPADPDKLTNAAWNILVAPRYANLCNYKTAYIETYNRPYFGMGNVKEKSTGKNVFVVMFRRSGGWIEIICPDSKSFANEFGFNPETIRWAKISEYSGGYVVDNSQGITIKADEPEVYNKLDNMTGRNKFAVDASDLNNTGEWKDHFSSNTFYSNYYTGAYMGISTFSSTKWFVFKPGSRYHWELVMGNSYGGRTDIAQAKGDGIFKSLNNWQLYFTDIEGKPKTFDVYFSAIKNGRVLWMNDAQHPGSGIFSGFVKSR
ncbi:MAG: hypothetical protein QM725_02105 [Lacibacter sp.]